ncbi:hypothetical protein [Spongiactinospora sp. TRM90649]|uniref:hypothetical protein n=1 Tax=Spongiactinospora sp. TRM90649 TaxID=3031114 RepID=UPI0023F7DE20|nr:hypothetical protein [Spongiactinospora sp. TRM90649]MDF5756598.1 hypothetical protein [Spongiactinospora sp. TRM90649]
MGTRGFIGFVAEEREIIAYNHFDSYPSGVGADVLRWLRAAMDAPEALRERVVGLRLVTVEDEKPTDEDIMRLGRFANEQVSTGSVYEWYVLLHRTQGNPHAMLEAGVVEDASMFPQDSLFCEWGYLVDLDAMTFEVYRGWQTRPHRHGRFARRKRPRSGPGRSEYYPVALAASWPLGELPTDEGFLARFGGGG